MRICANEHELGALIGAITGRKSLPESEEPWLK